MNNIERRLWILNDEGLFDWWRTSRLSMAEFIQQNRKEIDAAIAPVVEGKKPSHYLKYGSLGRLPSSQKPLTRFPRKEEFLSRIGKVMYGPYATFNTAFNDSRRLGHEQPDEVVRVYKTNEKKKMWDEISVWDKKLA